MDCRHKFTMCRLCLCESESFIDIFQVNEWFGHVTAVVIRDLLQFQVSEMDGFPHVVCSICFGKLSDFKQFKEQCRDSRDTYNDVFASDESHTECPIDIEEPRPVKLESKDPLVTQEAQQEAPSESTRTALEEVTNDVNATTEIRKSSIAFARQEYLSRLRKRTYGSYGNRSNSINDGGKPLSEKRKKVAVDANPCENIQSSDSAKVKVGKMDIKLGSDCKSPGDINRVESSVAELKGEMIKRWEEVNCIDASVDSTLEDEETFTLKLESESDTEGGSERERGEEAPPHGVNEREGKKEHFRCDNCRKDFDEKDLLIRHMSVHGFVGNGESCSEEREFQVNTNVNCGSKCNTNEVHEKGLKWNILDKVKRDEGVRKYVCDSCGKGFNKIDKMKRHLIVHSRKKPIVCAICDKRFRDRSRLGRHMFTHTGERPYTCILCCKRFTQNSHLKIHLRIHSGEKPYPCQVCNKCFNNGSNLRRHLRVHSQEKPYSCNVCNRCFNDRSNLKMHLRIHSLEKP